RSKMTIAAPSPHSLTTSAAREESNSSKARKYAVPVSPIPSAVPRPARIPGGTSGQIFCTRSQPARSGPNKESTVATIHKFMASDRDRIPDRSLRQALALQEAPPFSSSRTPRARIDLRQVHAEEWLAQGRTGGGNRRLHRRYRRRLRFDTRCAGPVIYRGHP